MSASSKKSGKVLNEYVPAAGQPIYVGDEVVGTVNSVTRDADGYVLGVALNDPIKDADYARVRVASTDAIETEVRSAVDEDRETVPAEDEPAKPAAKSASKGTDGTK